MKEKKVTTRAKVLLPVVLTIGLPLAALTVLEGGSSLLLIGRDLWAAVTSVSSQSTNTEYDPDLGWVAKKSFVAPDMYGPGIALTTNSRGFRGLAEVDDRKPPGKRRLVCSGDSFTLGYGVADDQTWCALLGRDDLETVNLGQIGYGVDQAYLAYLRDARALEHDVLILAFVTDDFARMALDRFLGYAKPVLQVRGDSLVVTGVPTVRQGSPQRAARIRRTVHTLRTTELLERLDGASVQRDDNAERLTPAEVRAVMARVVADLARVNAVKQSRLVLVYLPIERDHVNDAAREWREHMRVVADSLDVPLIDLTPALRQLGYEEVRSLYFQQSGAVFEGMGHFTPKGNRWAAERIAAALDSLRILPGTLGLSAARPDTTRSGTR